MTDWLDVALPTAEAVAPKPPAGARFFAILQTAIYDAWAAYDPVATGVVTGRSLAGSGGSPSELNRREAISFAAYTVLMHLAPARHRSFDAYMSELGYDPRSTSPAAVVGRTAANAVIAQRDQDGSNMEDGYADTTGYAPRDPSARDSWQPATEEIANTMAFLPMTPQWGLVAPFGLTRMDEFRPAPPPAFGTPDFDAQIETVLDLSAHLDDRKKAIAEYWANFISTPAVQWMSMTKFVSLRDDLRTDADVKLFFVVSNAMFDSSVAAWDAKYRYDYVRPYTAIRNLGARPVRSWNSPNRTVDPGHLPNEGRSIAWGSDPGVADMRADQWLPYLATPPFPSYISGHSTFAAAWAVVMRQATGSDRFGYDVQWPKLYVESRWLAEPVALHYPTFWSAAEECGLSRLYGGVHWPLDNTAGLALGQQVGERTWQQAERYFSGAAQPGWAVVSTAGFATWHHDPPDGGVAMTRDGGLAITFSGAQGTGRWLSSTLDALPAGQYRLRARVEIAAEGGNPAVTVTVLTGAPEALSLASAEATTGRGTRTVPLDVTFRTEGDTPMRIVFQATASDAEPATIRLSAIALGFSPILSD